MKGPRPVEFRRARPRAGAEPFSLFANKPLRNRPIPRRQSTPELTAARVLCRALRRKRESAEKKRIVHLTCLNLLAVLKRRAQQT